MASDINTNTEEQKKLLTIDYAFIVAILTGISYFLSFLFYAGKLSYLKVPLFFIDLSINNIIYSLIFLAPIIVFFTWHSVRIIREIRTEKNNNSISRKNKYSKKRIKWLAYVSIFFSVLFIIGLSFINKLLFFTFLVGYISSFMLMYGIVLFFKRQFIYLIIFFFSFSSLLAYSTGYIIASSNTKYVIFKEKNKNYIVLTSYKENFVVSEFDDNSNEYNKEYKILEMKNLSNFKPVYIGKVRVEK